MSGSGNVSGTGGGGFGGIRGRGGLAGTGGRGSYTFRGVPGSRNIGNWNTGGPAVGFGSLGGGIHSLAPQQVGPQPVNGPRGRPMLPMVQPPMPPAVPPTYPPVGGPPSRVDLNPATLAPWTGFGLDPLANFRNPNGNYQAQYNGGGPGNSFGAPDPSANYGNDRYGLSLGGFGGVTNRGQSRGVGGGFGGGGGGGW